MSLAEGAKAPAFTLPASGGRTVVTWPPSPMATRTGITADFSPGMVSMPDSSASVASAQLVGL